MNPLIIDEFGSRLTVNHMCLVFNSPEGEIARFEPRQIPYDSIVLLTHSGLLSLDAIRWLSEHKIPLYALDWRGRLQSSITHSQVNHGTLRLRQYQAHRAGCRDWFSYDSVPTKPHQTTVQQLHETCQSGSTFIVQLPRGGSQTASRRNDRRAHGLGFTQVRNRGRIQQSR